MRQEDAGRLLGFLGAIWGRPLGSPGGSGSVWWRFWGVRGRLGAILEGILRQDDFLSIFELIVGPKRVRYILETKTESKWMQKRDRNCEAKKLPPEVGLG